MRKSTLKLIGSLVLLGAFILVLQFVPLKEWLEPFLELVRDSGSWGYVIFVLLGLLVSLLMLPVTPVIIASGLLFGFWKGLLVGGVILALSTTIGFFIGKASWPRIKDYEVFDNRWFQAIREALENEGVYLVGLLRMTPFIHFTAGNLFYGSLSLNFWSFIVASILGMLPGAIVLTYAGHLAGASMDQQAGLDAWHAGLFAGGVVLFAGISVLITYRTRQILKRDS